jgi:phosphohistidine phosphatase
MPGKRLVLVRHAKSSWAHPELADHDRPLNARGRSAAAVVGDHLRQANVRPDLVVCSSATRARQTLELLRFAPDTPVLIEDGLYGATAGELLARIHAVPKAVESLALIAHNPGIEDLARMLASTERALAAAEKFPTAAVAEFRIPIERWQDLTPGRARLESWVVPRDVKPA